MGKKKREHVVFDQMLVPKKTIPFTKMNQQGVNKNVAVMKKNSGTYKKSF